MKKFESALIREGRCIYGFREHQSHRRRPAVPGRAFPIRLISLPCGHSAWSW